MAVAGIAGKDGDNVSEDDSSPKAPKDAGDVIQRGGRLSVEDSDPIDPIPGRRLQGLWKWGAELEGGMWLTQPPKPRDYLLSGPGAGGDPAGVLPLGKVGMLAGAGGAGKSWALAQLALSVATGRPWLATFTVDSPGAVLLALAEEEATEVRRRLYYAAAQMALNEDERTTALSRILILPLAGVPVTLTLGRDGTKDEDAGHETKLCAELRDRLEAAGVEWRLLILDPASRFAGPDVEVDNWAATRFVQVLERFTETRGRPTVLMAHHMSKIGRGKDADASAARGSSALTDGVRWQANVNPVVAGPDFRGFCQLQVVKNNYGGYPAALYLARDPGTGALRPATALELSRLEEAEEAEEERAKRAPATKRPKGNGAPDKRPSADKPDKPASAANDDDDDDDDDDDVQGTFRA